MSVTLHVLAAQGSAELVHRPSLQAQAASSQNTQCVEEAINAMACAGDRLVRRCPDHFSRLPPEFIAMVADHISLWELLTLRSACWVMAHGVERQFLDAFLTTRRHAYTPSSLEVLVSISGYPILRKRLQYIEITTTHPHDHTIIPHGKNSDAANDIPWARDTSVEINNMPACMYLLTKASGNLEQSRIYPKLVVRPSSVARGCDSFMPHNSDVLSFAFVTLAKTQYPIMDLDISSCSH